MFSFENLNDRVRLHWNARRVFDYNLGKGGRRTFTHPLSLPGSPALTTDRATATPVDHPHHQGLWVGWKKVNGVNFWEQPREGAEPRGYGRVVHQAVVSQETDVSWARLTTENAWTDWESVQHLTETRQATVHAPRDGFMVLDFATTLDPNEGNLTLDLNRGEPGQMGLYYSGVMLRYSDEMSPGKLLDAEGHTEVEEIFGSRSRWCGFSGRHSQDGKVYGITIIDHPENPRHPTTWWTRNLKDFCLLHPSPCYHEPFEVPQGEPLTLRYRLVLHEGPVDPDIVQEAGW